MKGKDSESKDKKFEVAGTFFLVKGKDGDDFRMDETWPFIPSLRRRHSIRSLFFINLKQKYQKRVFERWNDNT